MRIIVIHGPPLSGKSKHGQICSTSYGLQYISSGDIARALMDPATEKEFAHGRLSPHHREISQAVAEHITKAYTARKNVILDGFPRTYSQLLDLNNYHEAIKQNFEGDVADRRTMPRMLMINLNVPEDILLKRAERRSRDLNDKPQVLKLRMETYLRETSLVFDNLHKEQWIRLRVHIPIETTSIAVQTTLDKALRAYLGGHLDNVGLA